MSFHTSPSTTQEATKGYLATHVARQMLSGARTDSLV